jgi:tRNA G18 (ribose-2'-O)-methylase SpoU
MTHAIILDNIRSTHNVGSIMRSAEGIGYGHIFFAGITPYPRMKDDPRIPHESAKITRQINKTALGAETMSFSVHPDISAAITAAREKGYQVIGLEQNEKSVNVNGFSPSQKFALILGNEVSGILPATLSQCDVIIEIPMNGKKESLNVSVAGAIAMYTLLHAAR